MKTLFKTKEGKCELDAYEPVFNAVCSYIENFKFKVVPNTIKVCLKCSERQFGSIIYYNFIRSVDALYEVTNNKKCRTLPATSITLSIIRDESFEPENGEDIQVECLRTLDPSNVRNTQETRTETEYQNICNYFRREDLHHMARKFDPKNSTMEVVMQPSDKSRKVDDVTFRVTITNSDTNGNQFEETLSQEYLLSGGADHFSIKGNNQQNTTEAHDTLHIEAIKFSAELLEVQYNYDNNCWEYRICSDNTYIGSKKCYANRNFFPLQEHEPLIITVEGIGLLLDPISKPQSRK